MNVKQEGNGKVASPLRGTNMVDQSILSIDEHGKTILLKVDIDFVTSSLGEPCLEVY